MVISLFFAPQEGISFHHEIVRKRDHSMGFWDELTKQRGPLADKPKETLKSDSGARVDELTLHGLQGKTMSVVGDAVRIEKKTVLTAKREKTFPLRNISSVEVKKPGTLSGFIQLSIAGGATRNSSFTLTGGAFDAAQDENSVVFTGQDNYEIALRIKAYIEEGNNPQKSTAGGTETIPDQIKKLSELKDSGILSDEEFQQKKKELLARM